MKIKPLDISMFQKPPEVAMFCGMGPYISAHYLRNYLENKAQEWLDMPANLKNNPLNLGAYNFCRACLDDLDRLEEADT